MKEAIYDLLGELAAIDGVSGQETAKPGPTLAVFPHSDEIGMMVKAVVARMGPVPAPFGPG